MEAKTKKTHVLKFDDDERVQLAEDLEALRDESSGYDANMRIAEFIRTLKAMG